jgi:hypothetical protein
VLSRSQINAQSGFISLTLFLGDDQFEFKTVGHTNGWEGSTVVLRFLAASVDEG